MERCINPANENDWREGVMKSDPYRASGAGTFDKLIHHKEQ